jgi:hypothetical protein
MALRTPPAWLQAGSYTAENDRLTAQASYTTTGIVGLSSMAVTAQASPNMTVNVASGWAAIVGGNATNQGAYLAYNDATTILTVTSADPSLPRIDRVVATVSDAAYSGSANQVVFQVLAGTPNASPTAPSIPTNAISLATISIAAASTTIAQTAITDTRVPADSSLVYSKPGANAVINGGMDIFQRTGTPTTGIGITAASMSYTLDRWQAWTGAGLAATVSRQSAGLNGFQYCARVQRNSGQTATTDLVFAQTLETVNSVPLAGRTVTLSFYARAGSNFSAASNTLTVRVQSGTGTDESQYVGFTGNAFVVNQTATLNAAWQRFTFTGTVASTATQLGVRFSVTPVGTAGANDYYEITGVQLEAGSIATQFNRSAPSIQGELAACQRYYEKSYPQGVAPGAANQSGGIDFRTQNTVSGSNQTVSFTFPFKVTKRTSSPTVHLYDLYNGTIDRVWIGAAISGYTLNGLGDSSCGWYYLMTTLGANTDVGFHWTVEAEL